MKCMGLIKSISSFILIQSCGAEVKTPNGDTHVNASLATMTIPVSLFQATGLRLNLDANGNLKSQTLNLASTTQILSVSSYLIKLENCSSGLDLSNQTSANELSIIPQDTDCVGELVSFVLNGQKYTPNGAGAVPFKNYNLGSTAVFQGANAQDLIDVSVSAQLSSPVKSSDSIRYEFSTAHIDTSSSDKQAGMPVALTGTDAPNFKINEGDASLVSLVSDGDAKGAGLFNIKLSCSTGPMTPGADPNYNSFCPDLLSGGTIADGASGVDIGKLFSYKLIAAPNEDGTLSFDQAEGAFAAGGDSSITLSRDLSADSSGFQTITLTGPVTLSSNPKMVLILQAKNADPRLSNNPAYSSFQYFPINLAPLGDLNSSN